MSDKTVAELMELIERHVQARIDYFERPTARHEKASDAAEAALEQAIRRAVDWGEPVAYVPRCIEDGQYEVEGEFRFKEIDEKPFECWDVGHWTCTPLYARRQDQ